MKQYQLLNQLAAQYWQANQLLQIISNEKPFDTTHYAQTEARRNTLADVCRTIESVFSMDPGQAELALKNAR